MNYIRWFDTVSIDDIELVGGKNASLGTMIRSLSSQGVSVPMGFAITSDAYWLFIKSNGLLDPIKKLLSQSITVDDPERIAYIGKQVRQLMLQASLPDELSQEICVQYDKLAALYGQKFIDVAVRSSATAEDLPTASFAGQQESYLNIKGHQQLLDACKRCFASLFTDRAIAYRLERGFDHFKVGLSIGVQKMIRSDLGVSGVAFSLDPESGFEGVITINACYGLGEAIVQGMVIPDEYMVAKATFNRCCSPIIKKMTGEKSIKMVYGAQAGTKQVRVDSEHARLFALTDDEIVEIARCVLLIEQYYSHRAGHWVPMDVEWAKDGIDGRIYVVQARPETVHAHEKKHELTYYRISADQKNLRPLVTGRSIGQKIVSGPVRIVRSIHDMHTIEYGDILVTEMTDPDWVPVMKKTAGIITDQGGRTCHAAIVSRELGLPALVGIKEATHVLSQGQMVTIDCSTGEVGYVYNGVVPFTKETVQLQDIPEPPVDTMINIADPETAFKLCALPVVGVGLARLEFVINTSIKIHPMAIVHPERIADDGVVQAIEQLCGGYKTSKDFFVSTLAQAIGRIAAAFYPRPVIVRLSDFKTNEYRNLLGGQFFEPLEENPMIGFRGACRYYHEAYKDAFALECQAIKVAREKMGFSNIKIMVPFVRTIKEAQLVTAELQSHGLNRGVDGLQFIMMCEIPANVIFLCAFANYFDGFSIGSNDLTQLTLGVDRDSALLSQLFDERDDAVLQMMKMAIHAAHEQKKTIGICGQAPSDYPEIADYLIDLGINSMSLNPDSVLPFLMRFA